MTRHLLIDVLLTNITPFSFLGGRIFKDLSNSAELRLSNLKFTHFCKPN